MGKHKLKKFLEPSGLNQRFYGDGLTFDQYIELMRNIIIEGRKDLGHENANQIILANSPFSWRPPSQNEKIKKGVLLIHGLYDSPFYVRDLGEYFRDQGFLVHALLLPGHGTVPGDLLNIEYEEWIKSVEYGVKSLASDVEELYLCGYSLGGMLALHHVLQHSSKIGGLILFAPAVKPRNWFKRFLAKHHHLFSWVSSRAKWYEVKQNTNYAKYGPHCFNAGTQALKFINKVEPLLAEKKIEPPLFVVTSSDDETVCDKATIDFFLAQPNPKSKLILYTNNGETYDDPRIIKRKSHFPDLKVINFSHTCITISPDNHLLGKDSQFFDLEHYSTRRQIQKENIFLGAATRSNLRSHQISRLSYNPDYYNLLGNLDQFLKSLK